MRPIGFSTGAIAHSDFRRAVDILLENKIAVIELSALRQRELAPLVEALDFLDLSFFRYISVHAPSQVEPGTEAEVVDLLKKVTERGWPVIVHPEVIGDFGLWMGLGERLFIENMDKRKPAGRTASELSFFFEQLPKASLCLDLGHARQVDPTMSEAALILDVFGSRLGQLHVSVVNSRSTHDPLTAAALLAFKRISHLVPELIPVVLETPVTSDRVAIEIDFARRALPSQRHPTRIAADLVPRSV